MRARSPSRSCLKSPTDRKSVDSTGGAGPDDAGDVAPALGGSAGGAPRSRRLLRAMTAAPSLDAAAGGSTLGVPGGLGSRSSGGRLSTGATRIGSGGVLEPAGGGGDGWWWWWGAAAGAAAAAPLARSVQMPMKATESLW